VPILEITQAADVGLGSFYNHFDSKEELFRAAVDDALGLFAAVLDELTANLDDPAHVFAQGFRLTGAAAPRSARAEPGPAA
jgi:AcrR family transcriptional regulator